MRRCILCAHVVSVWPRGREKEGEKSGETERGSISMFLFWERGVICARKVAAPRWCIPPRRIRSQTNVIPTRGKPNVLGSNENTSLPTPVCTRDTLKCQQIFHLLNLLLRAGGLAKGNQPGIFQKSRWSYPGEALLLNTVNYSTCDLFNLKLSGAIFPLFTAPKSRRTCAHRPTKW